VAAVLLVIALILVTYLAVGRLNVMSPGLAESPPNRTETGPGTAEMEGVIP
jgi:hypothetical protein